MTLVLINTTGVALVALIVWWFWIYRPKQVTVDDDQLQVLVDSGVYEPANIIVPARKSFSLRFLRKDPSSCAEQVMFPDLGISATLGLNKIEEIQFPELEPGRYPFHCQMQMYRGQLEVK